MASHKKSKSQFANREFVYTCLISVVLMSCGPHLKVGISSKTGKHLIREINAKEIPVTKKTIAITGAMIVDGNGGEPVSNGCVVVKEGKITEVEIGRAHV